jgi:hypothetical protein
MSWAVSRSRETMDLHDAPGEVFETESRLLTVVLDFQDGSSDIDGKLGSYVRAPPQFGNGVSIRWTD